MTHVLRTPQIDLSAILTTHNPQIDLRLDAYEASTRNFFKAVGHYTNRAITEITNRRNGHILESKKSGRSRSNHGGGDEPVQDERDRPGRECHAALEKEKEELKAAESSVSALRRQLSAIREACASLDVELEQYRAITANLRRGMATIFPIIYLLSANANEHRTE
ncbi:hypothetical protein EW146_g5950 [Bondarzewia mesenterica]|uniref:Uncharacterized protein n=1 Tax=Bondarzewia mesenterica TaxID=1095465 RepID=A0A4V3XEP4_9AGAM|nr:hypothetical protein EW146_g5950 [Bondarzewia mesenterica]